MCGREGFKRNQPESHWPSDPSIPLLRHREWAREEECRTAELAAPPLHKSLYRGLSSRALSTAHKEKGKWKRIIKKGMFKRGKTAGTAFRVWHSGQRRYSANVNASTSALHSHTTVLLRTTASLLLPTSVCSTWNKDGQRQPLLVYKPLSQINLSIHCIQTPPQALATSSTHLALQLA